MPTSTSSPSSSSSSSSSTRLKDDPRLCHPLHPRHNPHSRRPRSTAFSDSDSTPEGDHPLPSPRQRALEKVASPSLTPRKQQRRAPLTNTLHPTLAPSLSSSLSSLSTPLSPSTALFPASSSSSRRTPSFSSSSSLSSAPSSTVSLSSTFSSLALPPEQDRGTSPLVDIGNTESFPNPQEPSVAMALTVEETPHLMRSAERRNKENQPELRTRPKRSLSDAVTRKTTSNQPLTAVAVAAAAATVPSSTATTAEATETKTAIPEDEAGVDVSQKPAIPYAVLICQAIAESLALRLSLGDIYAWIKLKHPYYRYSTTGWQNSIRHNLSLNKAFRKEDRKADEPGKGCFWSLTQDAEEIPGLPLSLRQKLAADIHHLAPSSSSPSTPATHPKQKHTLTKLDTSTSSPPSFPQEPLLSHPLTPIHHASPDYVPSPAASEDADDPKCPRRSGRARRPPRPIAEDEFEYSGHTPASTHRRHDSSSVNSLTTPPSSPDRNTLSDQEDSSSSEHLDPSNKNSTTKAAGAKTRMTTHHRIRRPPQNLSEFVSSEDFKAAPCEKRRERNTSASSSSAWVNGQESNRQERHGMRRIQVVQVVIPCVNKTKADAMNRMVENDREKLGEEELAFDLENAPPVTTAQAEAMAVAAASLPSPPLSQSNDVPLVRPASVSLSALSHTKRQYDGHPSSQCKKQRRDRDPHSKSHRGSRKHPSRQEILERRRRDGKREIMVASEDDLSDSDFDFLRDEQENDRLRIRALAAGARQRGSSSVHGSRMSDYGEEGEIGQDEDEDLEGYYGYSYGYDCDYLNGQAGEYGMASSSSSVERDGIQLLMDPSVINYGFDSCDAEYILDFNQGPLFNNVSWPEFSDSKDTSTLSVFSDLPSTVLTSIIAAGATATVESNSSKGVVDTMTGVTTTGDVVWIQTAAATVFDQVHEIVLDGKGEEGNPQDAEGVSSVAVTTKEDEGEFLKDYIGWSLCENENE